MKLDIIEADSLEIYSRFQADEFDLVVTDPPYASTSEASSSVDRVNRPLKDLQFFEAWLREHVREWIRILKPDGAVFMTIDWRGALVLDRVAAKLNAREPVVGVWDKEMFGMGRILRRSYECFVILPMQEFTRFAPSERDVWRIRWSTRSKITSNPAEKPPELFEKAIRLFGPTNAAVIDPFVGSGSSAVAAMNTACSRFVGIDRVVEDAKVRLGRAETEA